MKAGGMSFGLRLGSGGEEDPPLSDRAVDLATTRRGVRRFEAANMSSWSVANGKAPGTFWCKLHDARGNLFKAAIILDKTKQSQLYLESNAKPLLIGSPPALLLIKLQFRSMADSSATAAFR